MKIYELELKFDRQRSDIIDHMLRITKLEAQIEVLVRSIEEKKEEVKSDTVTISREDFLLARSAIRGEVYNMLRKGMNTTYIYESFLERHKDK